ncbi:hypothetical protein EA187_15465 [Lujinxingia sediminis]|uniref:Spore coat biosynthesis protein F n=1 Tax=Lujinxingia sediminis TaxID=2480984 RepID=A0ABY0CQE8_9DELT|nr:NTP transferase domain-containing protein [Lujinxingia sediminis]RVU42585.1 hypothetical protein EA187_15465 [Lujinxingia sediminis]
MIPHPRVGAVVVSRYSSSRLPGKALMPLGGRPLLGFVLERLTHALPLDDIVVATSVESSDDPIARFCRAEGVSCYRGDLHDVAGRFAGAARTAGFDFAARINGDNAFVDIPTLRQMIAIARNNHLDFLSNVDGRTFPVGMSIEILRTAFYIRHLNHLTRHDHLEHVTLALYQRPHLGRRLYVYNTHHPEAAGLHLAIDELPDLIFARSLVARMHGPHTDYDLARLLQLIHPSQGHTDDSHGTLASP